MYVQIPGHGRGKLNSAYSAGYDDVDGSDDDKRAGGARLLIQTISNLSGLQIDHYAEINLLGFINLTSIVGGVDVDLCQASDDSMTGAHFDAGPQTLTGSQALLFVRQRHGVGERSSDFDRVARQQVFIAGMLRNLLSSDLMLNPTSSARSSSRSAARSPSTAAWTSSPWPPRCRACSRAASPSRPSPASPTPASAASRCCSCRPRRCSPTSSPT